MRAPATTLALTAAGIALLLITTHPAPARMRGGSLVTSPAHRGDPHNAIIAVRTSRRLVALSFDDGPSRRWTPEVLRLLRSNGAHATFFDVGRAAAAAPALVRATLAAGDEVGVHTWSHPRLPGLTARALRRQIAAGAHALRATGARSLTLFRPPHGAFDRRVSAAVAAANLRLIGWDVVVERELRGRSAVAATAAVLRGIHPGAIVLAHDGRLPRPRTVAVLRRLLPALRHRGYRVVTVSDLLRAAGP